MYLEKIELKVKALFESKIYCWIRFCTNLIWNYEETKQLKGREKK